MENVGNFAYFRLKMNIPRKIKGFRNAFLHIFPFCNVENFLDKKSGHFRIFYVLRKA